MNELSSSLEEQIREAKRRAENFSKSLRQAREQEAAALKTFEDGRMKWTSSGSGDLKSSRNSAPNSSDDNMNLNTVSHEGSVVNSLRDSYNSVNNLMVGEEKHGNSNLDFKKGAELTSQITALEKQLKVQRSELIVSNAELRVAKAHSAALEQKISAQFVEEKKNNPTVGQLAAMEAFTKTLQTRLDENEKKAREERKEFSRTETELKRQTKDIEQQVQSLLMQKDGLVAEIGVHRQQGEIFLQALENANNEIDRLGRLLELSNVEVSQLKRYLEEIERERVSSSSSSSSKQVTSSKMASKAHSDEPPVFDDSILDGDISGDIAVDVNEISRDSNYNANGDTISDEKYVSVINSELERSQKSHENLKRLIDSFRRSEEDFGVPFPHIGVSSEPPVYPAVKTFPPPPPLLGGRYKRIPLANAGDNINDLRRSPEMIKRTADVKPKAAVPGSKSNTLSRTAGGAKTTASNPTRRRSTEAAAAAASSASKSSCRLASSATSRNIPGPSSRQPGSSIVSNEPGKRSLNVTLPTSSYAANTPPRLQSKREALLPSRRPASVNSPSKAVGSVNVTGRVVQVVSNVEKKGVVRKSNDSSSNRNSNSNIIIAKSKQRTVDDIIHDITALSASISSSLSLDHDREKRAVKAIAKKKQKASTKSTDFDNMSLESLSSGNSTDLRRSAVTSASNTRKKGR